MIKIGLCLLAVFVVGYVAACSHISSTKSRAFDAVEVGESANAAIGKLGEPSVRELPDKLYARYASVPCKDPCAERLWFENGLSFNIEAWSLEIDREGKVLDKAYWHSP